MKKLATLLLTAALTASAVPAIPASAAGSSPENVLILGDSIASGYGLDENEKNYGDIIADYYGCPVTNFAVPGITTNDLLTAVKGMNDTQKAALAKADVIIISIGGNDMIQYAGKRLVDYAFSRTDHKFVKDGVSASDVPEKITPSDMINILNIRGEDGLKEYVTKGGLTAMMEMNTLLSSICTNITDSGDGYAGIVPDQIVTNLNAIVSELKACNSDARIIIQTLYQPVQLDPEFVSQTFGTGNYYQMLKQLRINFNSVIKLSYNEAIKKISGTETADIYYTFTSTENGVSNEKNPGHAYVFTDIQETMAEGSSALSMDFHPNQTGHAAIAATLINTIGAKETDGGLLAQTYNTIANKADYPVIALKEMFDALDISLGDVDDDATVDAADASKILVEYSLTVNGNDGEFTERQNAAADINRDRTVDASDASLALQYYSYVANKGTESIYDHSFD